MIKEMLQGLETGYSDIHGNPLRIGDRVKSKRGHVGIITFGIYDSHYGIYIMWMNAFDADVHMLRKDFLYWSKELTLDS